jgi:Fis family transcriptional regulator
MTTPTPLRSHVQHSIRDYLEDMGCTEPENLYRRLLDEIEPPLIEEILRHTEGNQSRAARILGITRNTLREKIRRYDIDR